MKQENHNKGLFYHPSPRQLRGGSLIDDSGVNYGKDTSTKNLKASSDFAEQHKAALSDVDMQMPTLKSGSKKDRDLYRNQMAIYNKKVKDKEQGFHKQYKSEIMGNLDEQFLQAGYTKDKSGKWRKPASLASVPWMEKAIGWIPGATDFANRAISAGEKVYNKPNLENIMNAGQTLADSAMSGYNMGKQLADPKKLIKDIAIQQGKKALGMGLPRNYSNVDNHYNSHKRKIKGRGLIKEEKPLGGKDDDVEDVFEIYYTAEPDDPDELEKIYDTFIEPKINEMVPFKKPQEQEFIKDIFKQYFTSEGITTEDITKFTKDPKKYLEDNEDDFKEKTDIIDTNFIKVVNKINRLKVKEVKPVKPVVKPADEANEADEEAAKAAKAAAEEAAKAKDAEAEEVPQLSEAQEAEIQFYIRSYNNNKRTIKGLEVDKAKEKNKTKKNKIQIEINRLNEQNINYEQNIKNIVSGEDLKKIPNTKTPQEIKEQLLKKAKQIIIGRDLQDKAIKDGDTFESKLIKVLPVINNSLKKVENTKEIFKYTRSNDEEILATGAPFDFADIHDNKLKVIGEIKYGVTPEWEVYYDSQIQINNKITFKGEILAGSTIKSPVSGLKLQTTKFEGYDTYVNDAGETINDHWKILSDVRDGNVIIKTISFNNPNYGMSQIKDNLEISQYLLYAEMYDNEDSKNKSLYVCNLLKTGMFNILPGGKMKVKDEYKYKLPKPQEDNYDDIDDYLNAVDEYEISKTNNYICYVPFNKFQKVNKIKK